MDLSEATDLELQAELDRRKQEIWPLVDIYHAHFCPDEHNHACQFYAEKQSTEWKSLPAHDRWRRAVEKEMKDRLWSISDFLSAFKACSPLTEKFLLLPTSQKELLLDLIKFELR